MVYLERVTLAHLRIYQSIWIESSKEVWNLHNEAAILFPHYATMLLYYDV